MFRFEEGFVYSILHSDHPIIKTNERWICCSEKYKSREDKVIKYYVLIKEDGSRQTRLQSTDTYNISVERVGEPWEPRENRCAKIYIRRRS